jgi:hypothetical protein
MSSTERAPDYNDKTDETRPGTAPSRPGSPALEPNEARAGVTNHNVRFVLGISIVAIVVLFAIVYLVFFVGNGPSPVLPPA